MRQPHTLATEKEVKNTQAAIAEEIIACFKDVDWNRNTFNHSGVLSTTLDGQTLFYKANDIDTAIQKLSAVITKLQK